MQITDDYFLNECRLMNRLIILEMKNYKPFG